LVGDVPDCRVDDIYLFQFLRGAIGSNTISNSGTIVGSFNSLEVRLVVDGDEVRRYQPFLSFNSLEVRLVGNWNWLSILV